MPMLSMTVTSSLAPESLADRVIDLVAQPRRLFDARPGARTYVELELAGINEGKKSCPSQG